uniref:Uncharacterized protein n=1 Tax=Kalanchoe fedtschenkoi TaxID=63787 RepID=A0A7N0UG08_KALFE
MAIQSPRTRQLFHNRSRSSSSSESTLTIFSQRASQEASQISDMRLMRLLVFMLLAATITSSSVPGSSSSAPGETQPDTACYTSPQEEKHQYRHLRHQLPVLNGDDALDLDDYRPYDPSPSSKSRIHSGPIYHNTPLNPHMPKSPPPLAPSPV